MILFVKRFLFVLAFIGLVACSDDETTLFSQVVEDVPPRFNVRVNAVDEDGLPIAFESVSWGSIGKNSDPLSFRFLSCDETPAENACRFYDLGFDIVGSVRITFSISIPDSDPLCHSYIEGSLELEVFPAIEQEISVIIDSPLTVCA